MCARVSTHPSVRQRAERERLGEVRGEGKQRRLFPLIYFIPHCFDIISIGLSFKLNSINGAVLGAALVYLDYLSIFLACSF